VSGGIWVVVVVVVVVVVLLLAAVEDDLLLVTVGKGLEGKLLSKYEHIFIMISSENLRII
jgi:hypothetical protein